MKVCVYSSHGFEENYLRSANQDQHELVFIKEALTAKTATYAHHAQAVSVFVSDTLNREVLEILKKQGVQYLALRSAGYNHLDVEAARDLNLLAARVPAYSPNSVAEHAVALMLALNRQIVKADNRCHQGNFSLDGLVGFDMKGKTAGIIGTGKIGSVLASILHGFGCRLLAYDIQQNKDLERRFGLHYTSLDDLCANSDVISLHVPLTRDTTAMIDKARINKMKKGVMLINTGRGDLVVTADVIAGLEQGIIGYYGMDVYSDERLFFADHSQDVIRDQQLSRLMSFDKVIITGHQAFLTHEALTNIANTTIQNLNDFEKQQHCDNLIA